MGRSLSLRLEHFLVPRHPNILNRESSQTSIAEQESSVELSLEKPEVAGAAEEVARLKRDAEARI